MNHRRVALAFIAIAAASAVASAESVGPFALREDIASVSAIKDVIAQSSRIPLRKRYADMTQPERDVIRGFYTSMGPTDEPPFPETGLEPVVRALHRAQAKLLVQGELYLVVDVDTSGEARSVVAYGSPDPHMTKFAASVLMLQKFKPALCAGTPCAQKFPFTLKFVVE